VIDCATYIYIYTYTYTYTKRMLRRFYNAVIFRGGPSQHLLLHRYSSSTTTTTTTTTTATDGDLLAINYEEKFAALVHDDVFKNAMSHILMLDLLTEGRNREHLPQLLRKETANDDTWEHNERIFHCSRTGRFDEALIIFHGMDDGDVDGVVVKRDAYTHAIVLDMCMQNERYEEGCEVLEVVKEDSAK